MPVKEGTMVQIIIALVAAVFGSTGFWSWLSSRSKKRSDESRLLMGLAYSEIIRRSEEYIRRGWIGIDEYNELDRYLYQPYQSMGGNGTAEKLMQAVKALPVSKEVA